MRPQESHDGRGLSKTALREHQTLPLALLGVSCQPRGTARSDESCWWPHSLKMEMVSCYTLCAKFCSLPWNSKDHWRFQQRRWDPALRKVKRSGARMVADNWCVTQVSPPFLSGLYWKQILFLDLQDKYWETVLIKGFEFVHTVTGIRVNDILKYPFLIKRFESKTDDLELDETNMKILSSTKT